VRCTCEANYFKYYKSLGVIAKLATSYILIIALFCLDDGVHLRRSRLISPMVSGLVFGRPWCLPAVRLDDLGHDPLADEGALKLSDGTNDSEHGLANGRTGVDLLGDRYEVTTQMTELFEGINQLLGGLGDTVKLPDQHGIDLMSAWGLPNFGDL